VREDFLTEEWLGVDIDNNFIKKILAMPNIDPCAENGEYHSFVYDGPTFKTPVQLIWVEDINTIIILFRTFIIMKRFFKLLSIAPLNY
jgi:diphthamide synthase (EF-2-diphthine--ammonia ligase)